MKWRSFLSLLAHDSTGFAMILAMALCLGLVTNELRRAPLPLWSYQGPGPQAGAPIPEVTLFQLRVMSERNDRHVIDVRPIEFYMQGHVPGAASVPLSQLQAGVAPENLHWNDPIVVYCQDLSCPAAKSAAVRLRAMGYRDVSIFPGGWYQWQKAGLPIEYKP